MKRSLAKTAVTAVAAAGLVATGVATAHAQPRASSPGTIDWIRLSPAPGVHNGETTRKTQIQVHITPGSGWKVSDSEIAMSVRTSEPNGSEGPVFDSPRGSVNGGVWTSKWSASTPDDLLYYWEPTGVYKVHVSANMIPDDGSGVETIGGDTTWTIMEGTFFKGFKAGPAKIRKGKTGRVSGQLRRYVPTGVAATSVPYNRARVTIYFEKKGTHKWVAIGTAVTDRNGNFARAFKATATGSYEARFTGAGFNYPTASAAAKVTVR